MTTPMPTRITGFATLMQYLDTLTNGWFGPVLLLMIFGGLMFAYRGKSAAVNLANSAFITLFCAVLLSALQVLDWIYLIASFGLALIAFGVQRLADPSM